MPNDETIKKTRYRADVIRELTKIDNVGQVVFASHIAEALNLTERQVSVAIYQARDANNVLRDNVHVIVRGKAWRYLPSQSVTIPTPASTSTPLTNARPVDPRPTAGRGPSTGRQTRWRNDLQPGITIYELVNALPNGDLIIKAEDGELYRARKLE